MALHPHIFDDATGTDRVVPVDELMRNVDDNGVSLQDVSMLIDASRYEFMNEHEIVRGRFGRLNWNIQTDPQAGALAGGVWRTVGIRAANRFNPTGVMGWSYIHDAASRWQCPMTGWWDLDFWFRGSISVPAVPAALITGVHLAYRVTRHVATPQTFLQLAVLDQNGDVSTTSTPFIQEVGDCYAPFTVAGGPPVGTQTYLRSWSISGADSYPFYEGDIVELIWMIDGVAVTFLDNLEARVAFQRVAGIFLPERGDCCE